MIVILIVLALYGVSYLLNIVLNYMLAYYDLDEEYFWEVVEEDVGWWMTCPVISPFLYLWLIGKVLEEQSDYTNTNFTDNQV